MLKQPLSGGVFDLDNTLVSSSLNFNEIKAAIGCPAELEVLGLIHCTLIKRAGQFNLYIHSAAVYQD